MLNVKNRLFSQEIIVSDRKRRIIMVIIFECCDLLDNFHSSNVTTFIIQVSWMSLSQWFLYDKNDWRCLWRWGRNLSAYEIDSYHDRRSNTMSTFIRISASSESFQLAFLTLSISANFMLKTISSLQQPDSRVQRIFERFYFSRIHFEKHSERNVYSRNQQRRVS